MSVACLLLARTPEVPLVWPGLLLTFSLTVSLCSIHVWGIVGLIAVREEDIQKMLAAQVHIGTRNSDSQMQEYIWRRRHVSFNMTSPPALL